MTMPMSDEEMFDSGTAFAMVDAMNAVSKPNYYAIVPAFVRYNKSLTYLEKILYGELTALANKFGYCFATNQYFMDNFGNSERTVRKSISHLSELGFISIQSEISAKGTERKIFINGGGVENSLPTGKKTAPLKEKKLPKESVPKPDIEGEDKGNSTSSNSTSILYNTTGAKDATSPIPTWLGSAPLLRLLKLYELMFGYTVGTECDKIKIASAQCAFVKRLLAKYGESLSALFIIVHFEWRGLNGTDEAIHKRLENSGYPVMWINSALYYGFVKNHLGITTDKQTQDKLNEVLLTIIPKND